MVDYTDTGRGPPVVLVHSSASGNRQWRRLSETLHDRYRFIGLNLFGYGATTAWPAERPMTLGDPANLVVAACSIVAEPVILIGHSLGAAVSMESALRLGEKIRALIVYEPIPFYLLRAHGFDEAHDEIEAVARAYRGHAARAEWQEAGAMFVEYWSGGGAWNAMSEERRTGLIKTLPNIVHEWDAVLASGRPLPAWDAIACPTHVIRAADTRLPTYVLASMLTSAHPDWQLHEIPSGGHMAPVSHHEAVNPLIAELLAGSNG